MSIINKSSFPYIDAGDKSNIIIDYRENTEFWNLKSWKDKEYFYCEFKLLDFINEINVNSFIDKKTLTKIKLDSNTFLVLCNAHESFHSVVDSIYRYFVIKERIPAGKIIVMSESADLHKEVSRIAAIYKRDLLQVEWMLMFERNIKLFREDLPLQYFKKFDYTKKFLNLNRRWRTHRVAFVSLMIINDLDKLGYISLGKSDDNKSWHNMVPRLLKFFSSDEQLDSLIRSNLDRLVNTEHMYLDTSDLITNKVDLDSSMDEYYRDTYFTVVSETNYNTSDLREVGRFLSEKTFKPISYFHPFILISVPNSLQSLRELGYKTFHPYIDESYDLEKDDVGRMKMIVSEVKRLSNLSKNEIIDFIYDTRNIVEHNFNNLMSKNIFVHKKT